MATAYRVLLELILIVIFAYNLGYGHGKKELMKEANTKIAHALKLETK